MTSPSAAKDLLIDCASFSLVVSLFVPDLPTRSDPAKSTRLSLPIKKKKKYNELD